MKVYNTLSREAEEFRPINGKRVGMYVCGPTVYGPGHVGHARTYTAFDIIRRYLEYRGYGVKYVVNITDVHDDMIKQADKEGTTIFSLAEKNIALFMKDIDALGIKRPDVMPRVTENIGEIISLVQELERKGFAYQAEDGVYFRVSEFKGYGRLSNARVRKSVSGTRVEADKYDKANPTDFALWKKAKPGEPSWDSPWGKGRPGWHIECSAMSAKYLGKQFDVHGGAVDLVFPHHENEICQSEAAFGVHPFVRYWLHAGFLNVRGEKMSKSLGNYITIPALLAKFDPKAFRFFVAGLHYRSRVDFSDEAISRASKALEKWNGFIQELLSAHGSQDSGEIEAALEEARSGFTESMDDDFNLPNAWAALYRLQSRVNAGLSANRVSARDAGKVLSFLKELNTVFGFFEFGEKKIALDKATEALVQQREKFRKNGNYAESDRIRKELKDKGIELMDTPEGVKWKKA